MSESVDVLVVGGRPAGASLAMRLGQQGRSVMVLDRARLPSLPFVPSCPVLHAGTLSLLDELGVPEPLIATTGERFKTYLLRFGRRFEQGIPMPEVLGRNYAYNIHRAPFDHLMWEQLSRFPTVTARQAFVVEGVLRDDAGRVVGVQGHGPEGEPERLTARWVVGADGRFSAMARWLGAEVTEQRDEHASTGYYADWDGLPPVRPEEPSLMEVCTDAAGTNFLFFPGQNGRITVVLHQRADRVNVEGDAEAYYRAQLQRYPWYAERFAKATMTTRLLGLKKIGNGYREPAGPGWALVGDAFHFKDPVDGQGIYDALLCSRILAEELGACLDGRQSEAQTAAQYKERARAATLPMFEATLGRLQSELYGPPPNAVVLTLLRWLVTDPAYGERMFRFLCRDPSVDPRRWRPPSFIAGAMLRGAGRDLGLVR